MFRKLSPLAGNYPDYTMMIVGSNMGVVGMTKEHYQLTLALKIPVFMVVTKVRVRARYAPRPRSLPPHIDRHLPPERAGGDDVGADEDAQGAGLDEDARHCEDPRAGRVCGEEFHIRTVRTRLPLVGAALLMPSPRSLVPIFQLSSVTGECLDVLRYFLYLLPSTKDWDALLKEPVEFFLGAHPSACCDPPNTRQTTPSRSRVWARW